MHFPDGYVNLPVSVAGAAVAATGVTMAARRAAIAVRDRISTLPAVVSAYLLVAQLLVVPVGFGTSAHLIGTGLATVLVGPAVAIVCVATVVVLQALVFADGGVTAIGLNVINDGLVPALVTAAGVRLVWPLVARSRERFAAVAGISAALGALAGGFAAAMVLVLGGTDVVSHATIVTALGGAHVVVAGVEAVLTVAIVATVLRLRPDLVAMARPAGTDRPADPLPEAAGASAEAADESSVVPVATETPGAEPGVRRGSAQPTLIGRRRDGRGRQLGRGPVPS